MHIKRRWFLTGLALPVVVAGCQAFGDTESAPQSNDAESSELETAAGSVVLPARNDRVLVMATTANYPPYEQLADNGAEENRLEERTDAASPSTDRETDPVEGAEDAEIVGFDIDLAQLIAARLERELRVVNVDFGSLIPAVVNGEVDIAMAALEPNRDRKQQVDFSNIYYRSRHALVSVDGYLRSRNLSYEAIGVLENSVQARYAADLTNELSGLTIIPYPTTVDAFAAIDTGEIDGALVEANIANSYLRRYPYLAAQLMPADKPTGSAIALPKSSPLRSQINQALLDIKASGEMDRLIAQWFG